MHARVATFAHADTSRFDELIGMIKSRMDAGEDIPGSKGALILIDRQGLKSLGIAFFENEEAIEAAAPIFEKMGDEVPEEVRGKRISVEVYEVALSEVAEGATAARLSILEGAPDGIDRGIQLMKEQIIPEATEITGWCGVIVLADRTTGTAKTITLWDSQETLQASEERANELHSEIAEKMNEKIAGVERYEIALQRTPITV
jgi:hypothetical protein